MQVIPNERLPPVGTPPIIQARRDADKHAPQASNALENIVQVNAERVTLSLAHNECVNLTRARDTRVSVSHGLAWVTIDGQQRDVLLEGGQSFVVDSNEKVVVFALQGPASVELAVQ
jgi:hypothetical protein